MGLPKQPPLFVPLGAGVDTDTDPKLMPLGKVTQSENVLWTALGGNGQAIKRPGYIAMPTGYVTSGSPATLPPAWQLAQHKGTLLALGAAGPRPVASFSPDMGKWLVPPAAATDGINGLQSKLRGQLLVTRQPVERTNTTSGFVATNDKVDIASDGTLALVCWTTLTGTAGLRAKFIELATGNVLFSYSVASAGAGVLNSRAIYANGIFTVVWYDGTNLKEAHWTASTVTGGNGAISSLTTLATDHVGPPFNFDVMTDGTNIRLVYAAAASPAGKTEMVTWPAGNPGAKVAIEIQNTGPTRVPAGSYAWIADYGGSGVLALSVANSGGLQVLLNVGSGTASGSYLVDSGVTGPVFAQAGHTVSSAASLEFSIVYQLAGQPSSTNIGYRSVAHGVASQVWLNSTSLIGKTFPHNGDFYTLIAYESVTQGTFFAIRVPVNPADTADYTQAPSARFCTAVGNGPAGLFPCSVVSLNSSTLISGCIVRTREITTGTGILFDLGVDLVTLQFDPAVGSAREYADSTYVCGGLLAAFDGQTYAEEGFHVFPEPPVLTQTTGGSLTALGAYNYASVFKYTDANGRVHRSSPSQLTQIILTGGNNKVNISQKTLKLHGRPGQIAIEVYRVRSAGDPVDLLYLNQVIANGTDAPTGDTVSASDTQSDTSMLAAMPMYATTDPSQVGALASGPPPSPIAMCVYKGRLACVDADDPTLIRVSLPLTDFDGKGWPIFDDGELSSFRIEDVHGAITGIATVDDKLIIFKADAVYVVTGDGPDITGNGSWGDAAFVCIGTGCIDPRTIVEVPDGVMFRSNSGRAGYYLINRGLSLEYVGAPVEGYINDTITSAIHVPKLSRTEFFTSGGRTHVYDQAYSQETGAPQWTTFTNQAASAAGLYNGLPVYQAFGLSQMDLFREDSTGTVWDEAGTPNDEYLVTPWLSLASLKGYSRFYRVQGVGQFVGQHTVTVTMWTNFNDTTPVATRSIIIGPSGPTSDWGFWELKYPTKQSAVRFGIRCSKVPADPSDTAGANIAGITILWAAEENLRKIPGGNRLT